MKTISCLFFCVFTFAFCLGCGSDNPITNNDPDPSPTAADTTIKLYSPLDSSHYYEGDSIHYNWSHGSGAYAYRFYSDSSAQFLQNDYSVIADTSLHGLIAFNINSRKFIKIVPIINDTARFQYQSDTRLILFN